MEKLTKELETAKSEARGASGAGSSDKLKIEQLETDLTKLKSQLSIVESRCNQLSSDEAKLQKEIKKIGKITSCVLIKKRRNPRRSEDVCGTDFQ